MKKYIIYAVIVALSGTVLTWLMNLCFGEVQTFGKYAEQFIVFLILFPIAKYLDDKGWNSWSRVFGIFKRKKQD